MFIKLTKISESSYKLIDSEFEAIIPARSVTGSIIEIYGKYNLCPLNALKFWTVYDLHPYFKTRLAQLQDILDCNKANKIFINKYYPCLVNYCKKLSFIGKAK